MGTRGPLEDDSLYESHTPNVWGRKANPLILGGRASRRNDSPYAQQNEGVVELDRRRAWHPSSVAGDGYAQGMRGQALGVGEGCCGWC
jgi:hypothetical protein